MKPKLKVWRLQTEKRQLVLRDSLGHVRRIARSEKEKEELMDFWEKYNAKLKFEELPSSKRDREKLASQRKWLMKQGFIYGHIWCGTTINRVTHERRYKHLVIFKATPWTAVEIVRMDSFFHRHIPKTDLGIFVFHNKKLYMYSPDSTTAHPRLPHRRLSSLSQFLIETNP